MARISYGRYLREEAHCYTISNTHDHYAEGTEESYQGPPIELKILECSDPLERVFSSSDGLYNHPEIVGGLRQALAGELTGWKLTGVNIAADGIYMIYSTEHPPVKSEATGEYLADRLVTVSPSHRLRLMFEIDYQDGLPAERYEVEIAEESCKGTDGTCCVVRVTEYAGPRKRRMLEMREDNHGRPCRQGEQYCIITEY